LCAWESEKEGDEMSEVREKRKSRSLRKRDEAGEEGESTPVSTASAPVSSIPDHSRKSNPEAGKPSSPPHLDV
jgi:hypothetical protein